MKKRLKRRLRIGGLILLAAAGAWALGSCESIFFKTSHILYDHHHFDGLIRSMAAKHGLDSRLVKALIYQESRFNPQAVGTSGEIGLMQILPRGAVADWAKAMKCRPPSKNKLYEPATNLDIGCWYLARAVNRWRAYANGLELALAQYNAGPTRAGEWKPETLDGPVIDRITIPSTRKYVSEIMKRYEYYCEHNPFNE